MTDNKNPLDIYFNDTFFLKVCTIYFICLLFIQCTHFIRHLKYKYKKQKYNNIYYAMIIGGVIVFGCIFAMMLNKINIYFTKIHLLIFIFVLIVFILPIKAKTEHFFKNKQNIIIMSLQYILIIIIFFSTFLLRKNKFKVRRNKSIYHQKNYTLTIHTNNWRKIIKKTGYAEPKIYNYIRDKADELKCEYITDGWNEYGGKIWKLSSFKFPNQNSDDNQVPIQPNSGDNRVPIQPQSDDNQVLIQPLDSDYQATLQSLHNLEKIH